MGVAQLAEHRTVAPTVAGSIPVSHPNFSVVYVVLPAVSMPFTEEWPLPQLWMSLPSVLRRQRPHSS